jgi:hypothetical protein
MLLEYFFILTLRFNAKHCIRSCQTLKSKIFFSEIKPITYNNNSFVSFLQKKFRNLFYQHNSDNTSLLLELFFCTEHLRL